MAFLPSYLFIHLDNINSAHTICQGLPRRRQCHGVEKADILEETQIMIDYVYCAYAPQAQNALSSLFCLYKHILHK